MFSKVVRLDELENFSETVLRNSVPSCSMGNSLSPLLAEAFMFNFESELKRDGILPRIWWRYVDDTFAVVKVTDVDNILSAINNRYPSVKFTHEKEHDIEHTLEFLDMKIETH